MPDPHDTAWRTHAACRGADPELFFPARGDAIAPAQEVCAGCPVRDDCLEDSLVNGEKFGIWGGIPERQRRLLRSARRRQTA